MEWNGSKQYFCLLDDFIFKPPVIIFYLTETVKMDPYVYLNISLTDSPVVFENGFELNVKVG